MSQIGERPVEEKLMMMGEDYQRHLRRALEWRFTQMSPVDVSASPKRLEDAEPAVVFALKTGLALSAIVPSLAGAIVQVVADIVFGLYRTTTSQLSGFSKSLEMLQRYLLAYSICERIDGAEQNKARAALVQEIAQPQTAAEKRT
jgi:hypothetical protein